MFFEFWKQTTRIKLRKNLNQKKRSTKNPQAFRMIQSHWTQNQEKISEQIDMANDCNVIEIKRCSMCMCSLKCNFHYFFTFGYSLCFFPLLLVIDLCQLIPELKTTSFRHSSVGFFILKSKGLNWPLNQQSSRSDGI